MPKSAKPTKGSNAPATNRNKGEGGETHQHAQPGKGADDREGVLTTNHGTAIADNQNSLKSGARGPVLLEDFHLREKIFHFDHERIPERIVHARGSGAHGYFECTDPIPDLSRASLFGEKGKRTPVFTRFSTVAGSKGSKDTPRDVRGFAVKFYTDEGNWDLVGNNMPVFFIQDAIKFPDLVHAVKPEADRMFPQAASAHDTFWDFVSLMPESTHMLTWLMSDFALPRSFRTMQGFGVHTFRLVNAEGKSTFVKFHWRPRQGTQSTVWDEAVKLSGADPDLLRRDLWEAIQNEDYPEWDFAIQAFDLETARSLPFDVLDASKLIPEEIVPLRVIGRMVLDRWPDTFFAETEQVAFLPHNVVPGIDFTNDPLLQGRLFSYLDTQKSRLGTTNFFQIPVNQPKCPFANLNRDGLMQTAIPKGRANYEPNSLDQAGEDPGPREDPQNGFTSFRGTGEDNDASEKLRVRAESFADHFSQARMMFASQTEIEQAHMASAFVFELSKVELEHVRIRTLSQLRNVDEGLAKRVADGLAMPLPKAAPAAAPTLDLDPSDKLSIVKQGQPPMQGRKVGILFDEGSSLEAINKLKSAVEKAGGTAFLVAPKVGEQKLKGGTLQADGQLAGSPSVLFDAIACAIMPDNARKLAKDSAAQQWFMDAYSHCKTIGYCPATKSEILDKLGIEPDAGVIPNEEFAAIAPARHWDREPKVRMLA